MPSPNTLYYGDNLEILREYVRDESVDLVYLDPPFNSNANYNVLFAAKDGSQSAAQIQAFEDTWRWDEAAAEQFEEILQAGGRVAELLAAFQRFLGTNDMLAYLVMMAPRLVELHRVLKPTGSLYLHCDPTASHYLKLLLDAVFGPVNFRSEIVWQRSAAHSDTRQGMKQPGRVHDLILFYTKGSEWTWNPQFTAYTQEYTDQHYRFIEPETGRRFRKDNLTASKGGGDTSYEFMGVRPYKGRYWAYSRANMERFAAEGRLVFTRTGMPEYKRYLDEMPGVPLQDLWSDIPPINSQAAERLGYPTQKPLALLERIIAASSNPGDVVLDPFCGCGTTIDAAQKLGRRWVGIDITHLAIGLIKSRLADSYGGEVVYDVIGEPTTVQGAEQLAEEDKFQFQAWALGLVGARTAESAKKGADRGIDGRQYFQDGRPLKTQEIIYSVKAGGVTAAHVRDLVGVVTREKAAIGVMLSLKPPTAPMRKEAASAGFYTSELTGEKYPRIQLLTVGQVLEGTEVKRPRHTGGDVTLKRASRVVRETGQGSLL